jgi:hypothetical protein
MARSHILKAFSDIDTALWLHKHAMGLRVAEMVSLAKEQGLPINDSANFEAAQVLAELGLADKDSRSLSQSGNDFYRIWQTRRSDAVDILHGLQYGLWKPKNPSENVASWAYRTICDHLWEREALPASSDSLARYVNSLRSADTSIPANVGGAFSNKSIADAYDWLIPLDPPVLYGVGEAGTARNFRQTIFQRRSYCSTPLFLMAIDHLMDELGQQYGDLLIIDSEHQRRLCAFCLIEEPAIEFMFDDALRRFPHLLSFQREWGIFVTLTRRPQMADFV